MNWNNAYEYFKNHKSCYYFTKNGILLNDDSLNILNELPNNFIDLILTDPPYNIANTNKLTKRKGKIISTEDAWNFEFNDKWNSIEDYYLWLKQFIKDFKRILKNEESLIMFLDRNYTGYFIYKIIQDFEFIFKNKIYFEKKNPLPHIRKNNYRSCIEEAIWFTKSNKYYFNFRKQNQMKQIYTGTHKSKNKMKCEENIDHPTEKHEWMIKPLILNHSNENHIILDSFAGSGTVLVLAEKLNRKWIGIEKNEKYCEIIKNRIQKIQSNIKEIF